MHLIDTHTHLYDEAFDVDRQSVIERAVSSGVDIMLLPDIDSQSYSRLECLYTQNPVHFRPMVGLHPTSVRENYEEELSRVYSKLFETPAPKLPYIAVGEIGMDLYWDKTFKEEQQDALRKQMGWAEELSLPVCLHIRKAMNEVFELLRDIGCRSYRGVMHCFGGSVQEAMRAVEMGFYIGVGGVVTFKNATLAQVVRAVPLERVVLETDAPYLSPVPHRGQRNESSYIVEVAKKVAELREISVEEVAEQTSINAEQLFGL